MPGDGYPFYNNVEKTTGSPGSKVVPAGNLNKTGCPYSGTLGFIHSTCGICSNTGATVSSVTGISVLLANNRVNSKSTGVHPISSSECEILKLGVVDTYKGLGIGEKLMRLCIETCQEKKVGLITLETNSLLESAIRLYEKLGFVHVELKDS